METKVISRFKGTINNIEFDSENLFYSVDFLLSHVEERFGTCYSDKFIEDLRDTVENMDRKYESFSYAELENEFYECIENADKFNEIEFSYYGSSWKIERLNDSIKNNEYAIWNKKKENLEMER
ncbi:hypothetical protein [Streptobacillus moniliformis]|uniref:hypothetical protein n=1 Tax=Streptobacillus moniliformis TaxID=34105 RepID=UPI0007E4B258|nr:hypothetical protein [Streptobacillus moniliformis]